MLWLISSACFASAAVIGMVDGKHEYGMLCIDVFAMVVNFGMFIRESRDR